MTPLPTEPAALLARARADDRVALARLLSYVERGGETAMAVAELAYRSDVPFSVGLTGAPGAGKSTLTDRLITEVRGGWPEAAAIPQVAVLAVDPTSPFSGGAILGDRVRMGQHTLDPTVFIRSMATRGHLGGRSLAVPDAIRLLGAAGLGDVIVETTATGGEGVAELWRAVARHRDHLVGSGQLAVRRSDRVAQELRRVLLARTEVKVDELVAGEEFTSAVKALAAGELDPYQAAESLLAE